MGWKGIRLDIINLGYVFCNLNAQYVSLSLSLSLCLSVCLICLFSFIIFWEFEKVGGFYIERHLCNYARYPLQPRCLNHFRIEGHINTC